MKWDMPKSLHTVTVLVNVAEHLLTSMMFSKPKAAIYEAARILDYHPVSMPPAIFDQALARLTKKLEN